MSDKLVTNDFNSVLSLDPLLDFWRVNINPHCPHMAEMFSVFEKKLQDIPALNKEISDLNEAIEHQDVLKPLLSVAFPSSTWDSELTGAFKPFSHEVFYCTPGYQQYLIDDEGLIAGWRKEADESLDDNRRVKAYALILSRLYGIDQGLAAPFVRIVTDPASGLERHF